MRFQAIPTHEARAFRTGQPDANGHAPERTISDGGANPCRHCLQNIPKGDEMLILSYRPFTRAQAYAETGPIFLCAKDCIRHEDSSELPPILTTSPDYLIKGYSSEDRIVYGTGQVVETPHMKNRIAAIFDNPDIAYVHVRSARNNCYQARVERGSVSAG